MKTRHTVRNALRKRDTIRLEGLTYYAIKCLFCGRWFLTRDKRQDNCGRECGGKVAARRRLYGNASANSGNISTRDSKSLKNALNKLKSGRSD